jgi:hypothetical protein
MNMKKILIVSCTKGEAKNTLLYKSLSQMKDDVKLVVAANNTKGLPEIYNRYITSDNLVNHDIVLFVHDDVYIDDLKLQGKLYTAMQGLGYDITGLAGAKNITIKEPCLWHLMAHKGTTSGSVSHPVNDSSKTATTCFGPWPERCLVLDGLFMAVNLRKALEVKWKFNTNYTFHHYDMAACLDANKKKMKMGTYPIYVNHASPGLFDVNDKLYQQSQNQFLSEYN